MSAWSNSILLRFGSLQVFVVLSSGSAGKCKNRADAGKLLVQ